MTSKMTKMTIKMKPRNAPKVHEQLAAEVFLYLACRALFLAMH